jgi:hypothetical protein
VIVRGRGMGVLRGRDDEVVGKLKEEDWEMKEGES